MNEDDPINVAYSEMVAAMGQDELDKFETAEFNAEVDCIANQFTKAADYYAEVFDPFVVAAALHKVWADYDSITTGDDDATD